MQINEKKSSLVIKNVFYGFGSKLIILVLGIIIPRLVITSFGSELNGFLSTITQIFTYFALLEAGIGNSAVNALYSPLENSDYNKANFVMAQARSYYRKATAVYIALVVAFAFGYPFLMGSTLSKSLMIKVVLLQGLPSAISYYFCAVYEQLLMADGKRYISENVALIHHLLTSGSKILLILLGFDIIAVQVAFLVISILKIPVVVLYCKKKYKWLSFKQKGEQNLLKERSAFVVHEVSSTIFSNTDVIIISIFCGFEMASVYTVYNMVFSALNSLVNTANSGLGFVLGRNLDKPREDFHKIFDIYSSLYSLAVFAIMTTATVLSIPFVTLYTSGIHDVNYVDMWMPILFGLINVMSGARAIHARLITVSGHAKQTQYRSVAEMIINIVFSLILVYLFDIYGVLLGTIVALLYRMNDIIIYAEKKILKRSCLCAYINLLSNLALFALAVCTASNIAWRVESYFTLCLYGAICFVLLVAVFSVPFLITNRHNLSDLSKIIRSYLRK